MGACKAAGELGVTMKEVYAGDRDCSCTQGYQRPVSTHTDNDDRLPARRGRHQLVKEEMGKPSRRPPLWGARDRQSDTRLDWELGSSAAAADFCQSLSVPRTSDTLAHAKMRQKSSSPSLS